MSIRGTNPLLYYSEPAKCYIRYTAAIQKDGVDGEVARFWWRKCQDEWREFGHHKFPRSKDEEFELLQFDVALKQHAKTLKTLENLQPGLKERLEQERRDALTPEERKLLDLPPLEEVEPEIEIKISQLRNSIVVDGQDFIEGVDDDKREEAVKLVKQLADANTVMRNYRGAWDTVGYGLWTRRCEAELSEIVKTKDAATVGSEVRAGSTVDSLAFLTAEGESITIPRASITERIDLGIEARRLMFEARKQHREGRFLSTDASQGAIELYEKSFEKWRIILDNYPPLVDDGDIGDSLIEVIRLYWRALEQDDREFPKDFVLQSVIDRWRPGMKL